MRCSDCAKPVRPVVAVDIDGTLGDYHGQFVTFAEDYLGRSLPHDFGGDVEFNDHLGIEKETYREVKLAYRQGGLHRMMPIFDGAKEFMEDLRDAGLEVWIATTRPYLRLDNIDPDTRHWLDRHGIHYDAILYGEDKYRRIQEQVEPKRIIGVVDDLLEQCMFASRAGLRAWQPERDHNFRSRFEWSYPSLRAIWAFIAKDLESWEVEHGEVA